MGYTDIPDSGEPPPPDEIDSASEEDEGRSMRYRLQIASNLVTLLVAVSAIGLSVWEGCEARRHNRLAVLPNLDVNERNLTVEAGGTVRVGGRRRR